MFSKEELEGQRTEILWNLNLYLAVLRFEHDTRCWKVHIFDKTPSLVFVEQRELQIEQGPHEAGLLARVAGRRVQAGRGVCRTAATARE